MAPRPAIVGKLSALLVDIDLRGMVLRYTTASEAVTVSDHNGVEYLYEPGLDVGDVTREVGSPLSQIGITIARGANPGWARLRARGYRFILSTAILRQYYGGQTLEQSEVLIRGMLTGHSFGGSHELFSAGIERQLREGGMIPGPEHRIGSQTWPVQAPDYFIDPASVGQDYMIVVGYPGLIDGTDIDAPTTPIHMVEWAVGAHLQGTSTALISMGHVEAANVEVSDTSHPPNETNGMSDQSNLGPVVRPTILTQDLLGQDVTLIDWDDADIYPPKRETPYRVAWNQGGGILNRERTAAMRGAGEELRWLLEEWTDLTVDSGRMEAQRAQLDAYKFDFVIGQRTRVWDFVRSRMVPLLPVDWRESENGGYFQLRRLNADRTDVVYFLVATEGAANQNCSRTAPLTASTDRVYNRITVHYAPGGQQGAMLRTVIVDAKGSATDDRIEGSFRAAVSQTLHADEHGQGGVKDLVINADLVYDRSTAQRIARDALLQYALPREFTSVQGGPELDALDLNDVVAFTDTGDDLAVVEEIAIVMSKTTSESTVALTLLLLDDPARFLRGTT